MKALFFWSIRLDITSDFTTLSFYIFLGGIAVSVVVAVIISVV